VGHESLEKINWTLHQKFYCSKDKLQTRTEYLKNLFDNGVILSLKTNRERTDFKKVCEEGD
jgi:hypothetical protein